MKICPRCYKIYPDSENFCSEDGTPLKQSPGVQGGSPSGTRSQQGETVLHISVEKLRPGDEALRDGQPLYNPYAQGEPHRSWKRMLEDNLPDQDTWRQLYLNFKGRVHRGDYFCRSLWLGAADLVVALFAYTLGDVIGLGDDFVLLLEGTAGVVLILMHLSLGVRRLHDRNASGWWMLLLLIPALQGLFLLYLLLAPTPWKPNRYDYTETRENFP
ncbi:DUF805 domain-containing protein [Acidaminococcus sp. NSJ-142]|uniref:DUF805 domain-containing protein n=1 Tax=Acidaminococcus TaxID=904 RepID=UPI000CFA0F02|nr:DUF805 domain-containing protein [Acidaminococcus provencensis]MCD2434386.1 DUF805 domain-containing protein [Acidaminococcus hominis]MCH4096778.1 DUF805 domain-containing protein [Acidaminococcus provencensis]